MPIRNICVARGSLSTVGSSALYSTPANNAFILKDIRVSGPSAAANVILYLTGPAGNPTIVLAKLALDVGQQPGGWSGWAVINAGDFLAINTDTVGVGYWVSGAVLPYATP